MQKNLKKKQKDFSIKKFGFLVGFLGLGMEL